MSAPLLSASDLSKHYGRTPVFQGVTFSVARGEVLALIGPSGSGKTTLLKCLNLVSLPTSGTIEFEGKAVFRSHATEVQNKKAGKPEIKVNLHEFRRNFGMVFQDFNLWPNLTLFDNIAAPLKWTRRDESKVIASKVEHYASLVQIEGLLQKYPSDVSGGEKQRAAIARALIVEPKVLLLDEITSALDPELVSDMLALVMKLRELGHTMVVVTHYMQFARRIASHAAFLHGGALLEYGQAREFFERPRGAELSEFLDHFREL